MTAVQAPANQPVDLILIVDTYHHIGGRELYFKRLIKSIRPIIDFKPDLPRVSTEGILLSAGEVQV